MNDEFTPDEGPAHDVAWIVDALRSPARPGELDGAETAVSAMAAVVAGTIGTTLLHPRRSSRRIAALIGTAIVGIGGVAAAGTASVSRLDHDAPKIRDEAATTDATVAAMTIAPTTLTTTTTTIALQVLPDDHDLGGDDGAADLSGVDPTVVSEEPTDTSVVCAEGNHGKTVSSVALEVPPGPDHGPAVATAAHSDCGKSDDDGDAPDDTGPAPVVTDTTAVADETVPQSDGNGNAIDHANANAGDGAANAGDGAANANDHANSDTPANSDTAGDRNEHGSERSTDHGSSGKTGD